MWKKVKIDDNKFFIKHSFSENLHRLLVTDLINLWYEDVDNYTLLLRCKGLNKLLEASDEDFLSHVLLLVDSEGEDIIRSFSETETNKILNLQTSLEGFKFRMNFPLVKADNAQFYEEVTCPLLMTLSELEKRQHLLVNMIKGKDVEILEYKLEGGQITRKAVETVTFDQEAFSAKCAEDVSVTKSRIASNPSEAITPLVHDLLVKISAAPIISVTQVEKEKEVVENKKIAVKLKSPLKNRKQKMYDEEDDDSDTKEEKVKRVNQVMKKRVKGNRRLQNVL